MGVSTHKSPQLFIGDRKAGLIFVPVLLALLAAAPARADFVDTIVGQVSQEQYTHYLSDPDFLYTHTGDNRGLLGAQHDPARTNIFDTLTGFGLSTRLDPFAYAGGTYYNVVGVHLGATNPNQIYLVGAHYDSVNNPGADDNASGVAGVLEAARVLSQYAFDSTLVFVAFDREEQGLYGSRAYATNHAADNILGMISMDMIGYNIPGAGHDTVRLYDWKGEGAAIKSDLAVAFAEHGGGLTTVDSGTEWGSDHSPFNDKGFNAALVIEYAVRSNPYYHTLNDSVDTAGYIDYAYATNITRGVVGYLATSAGAISVAVPEPSHLVLLASGALILALLVWRRGPW